MAAPRSASPFVFANELADDRQASVLYSPFRDKSLNPHSWNRKMKFWENLLLKTFKEHRIISFDASKLPEMFERNGLTPKCLSSVVEQMKSSGQLRPISQYKKNSGWLSWGFNTLVKQPVYWGVTQLMGSPKKDQDVLVCPDVVKTVAAEFLQLHQSCVRCSVVDSLVSLTQLKGSCQDLIPGDEDFQIILTHLERENHIAVSHASNGEVIVKFRKEGEKRVCFQDLDLNMYSIKIAVEKLEKEMHVLSSQVTGLLEEAKVHNREGRKRMALMSLRRKASLLKLMDSKSGALTMLHEIMGKIEQANTNEMIVKACEAGLQAMKRLNVEVTTERAESVMDDVHEAMALQEEVNDILSSPISKEDEEELERSLEELLKGENQEQLPKDSKSETAGSVPVSDDIASAFLALEIDDLGLPEVPSHSPYKEAKKDPSSTASTILPS